LEVNVAWDEIFWVEADIGIEVVVGVDVVPEVDDTAASVGVLDPGVKVGRLAAPRSVPTKTALLPLQKKSITPAPRAVSFRKSLRDDIGLFPMETSFRILEIKLYLQ